MVTLHRIATSMIWGLSLYEDDLVLRKKNGREEQKTVAKTKTTTTTTEIITLRLLSDLITRVHLAISVVTSGHVTKMAVTPFDRPKLKILCRTHTSVLHRSVCYKRGVIGDGIFTPLGSGMVRTRRFPLREYWIVVDLFLLL